MLKEVKYLEEQDQRAYDLFSRYNLSVSSVKYSRGHDGDCMNANLKIGSKIVGHVWDDSWGGGYDYQGEKVGEFLAILDKISEELGPRQSKFGGEYKIDHDILVYLLIKYTQEKRDTKKKTVVYLTKQDPAKTDRGIERPAEYTYSIPFNELTMPQIMKVFGDLEEKGYKYMEVVNKRFA